MKTIWIAAVVALCSSLSAAQQSFGATPFYNIAHMTNTTALVDWAVKEGANGLEADLNFNVDGAPIKFRHGGLCDCSCPGPRSVCNVETKTCGASTPAIKMLNHVATKKSVALFIVDSKISNEVDEKTAGASVIKLLDAHLFGHGYVGKVIVSVGSPDFKGYIAAAAEQAKKSRYQARIYFSFDEATSLGPAQVLEMLKGMTKNVSYGYGITACWFRFNSGSNLREAVALRPRMGGITYAWSYESSSSMTELIDEGVTGIITNEPAQLAAIVKDKSAKVRLARPKDPFPPERR